MARVSKQESLSDLQVYILDRTTHLPRTEVSWFPDSTVVPSAHSLQTPGAGSRESLASEVLPGDLLPGLSYFLPWLPKGESSLCEVLGMWAQW